MMKKRGQFDRFFHLTVNYSADWENTHIGGKVYFDNTEQKNTDGSLLVLDSSNQVIKSNTLIDTLLSRITALENKPAIAVPLGMVAIWGKPAPFPEGWEEYVPLRGRVPVGFSTSEIEFNTINNAGGFKSSNVSVAVPTSGYTLGENTSRGSIGRLIVSTGLEEDSENLESIKKVETAPNINFVVNNLSPYRVVNFIEYTGNLTDKEAPTTPTNLTASNIGTTNLILSWTASTDNIGINNYQVFKDGILLKEISNTLSYNVTGLSKGTSFNFSVKAKDAAGNLSGAATVNATTLAADLIAPTLPSYFQCFTTGQGNIGLQWGTSTDEDNPISYELSRKIATGPFIVFKTTLDTFHYELGSPNITYSYRVRAIDPSGNASAYKEASITLSSF